MKKTRILALEPECFSDQTRAYIEVIGSVVWQQCTSQNKLKAILNERRFDAIITKLGLFIGKDELDNQPELKWIATPTTGVDHLDQSELRRRNIQLITLKDYPEFLKTITATAEHTWGLLLSLLRRIPSSFDDVKSGNWRRLPHEGDELCGKTLGVIGCGRLGKMVAKFGDSFGMRILVNDIDPLAASEFSFPFEFVELKELLKNSNVVTLHVPLNAHTAGLMGTDEFKKMNSESILINTSRGEIVDEASLLTALNQKKIAGAAVDVMCDDASWPEKTPTNHALVKFARENSNLIITPHISGYAKSAIQKTRNFVAERLVEAIQNL